MIIAASVVEKKGVASGIDVSELKRSDCTNATSVGVSGGLRARFAQ